VRFYRSQVAGTKIFLAQGIFFMREFVFYSQQTNPQYKTRPNWAKQLPAKKACARTQSCKSCKAKAQTCHPQKKKKSFRGLLLTAAATPAVIITTDRLKKCYDTPSFLGMI